MSQAESDSSEFSEGEEEEEEEDVKEVPREQKWVTYAIPNDEKTWFKNSTLQWKEAVTDISGCCSLDSVAVAFGLPRTSKTWAVLRTDIAYFNSTGITDQISKLYPDQHLETSDLAYITLARFETVPIIINDTAARKLQANAMFAISEVYYKYLDALITRNKIQGLQVRYVIYKFKGGSASRKKAGDIFTQQGAGHFVTLGVVNDKTKKIQTLFLEKELPQKLLDAFYGEIEALRSFYTMPVSERRKNKKKIPTGSDVILIE